MFKALKNFFSQHFSSEGVENKNLRANVYNLYCIAKLLKRDSVRRGGVYAVVCISVKLNNTITVYKDINFFDDTCVVGDVVKIYRNSNGAIQVYRHQE